VAAATGEPVFYEALLRMDDSAGQTIAAAHLIPVAEKLGLVRLIDRAVVQMAIATLQKYPQARMSLNISGTTAADPRWYPQITDILSSNSVVTNRLIVEITETVALSDRQETRLFIEQLRNLGCSVAIDDLGAGHTSFRNLRSLPVDILKIDGSFCRDLKGNAENRYFVRSLIELARTFKLRTVAEWVENEDDAALLREWQIDYLQGNMFGEARLNVPWLETAAAEYFLVGAEPAQPLAVAPFNAATVSDPVRSFAERLPQEASKLRQAITALDTSFRRDKSPEIVTEDTFADQLSNAG
jgi:EAL domain-containing protein (putative c-di-GMP-specific phosphodiesterase class I)